ncbi:MAG: sigma-70 family RNA polymerase sigma factor [Lachnospiraceae bacterium]|nr:sigma-70 family RNA polymerase sigma factor [Lachnospiraceae bacterium]
MKELTSLSDEELIIEYRDGDKPAVDILMVRYKDMVRNLAGSMYIIGGETEDLIQEGMIGLFEAVRDYDSGRDASFRTFAKLCVSRKMYSAIKLSGRKKHMPLNTYISIYNDGENREDGGNAGVSLQDILPADSDTEPESIILGQEKALEISEAIENELSAFEKSVMDLYMTGMGYAEIARVLGRDEKSTDNALQRIRGKLKKYL